MEERCDSGEHNPVADLNPKDEEVKKVKAAVLISNEVMQNSTEAEYFPEFLALEHFNHSLSLKRLKRSIVRIHRMIEKNRPNKQHIFKTCFWFPFC